MELQAELTSLRYRVCSSSPEERKEEEDKMKKKKNHSLMAMVEGGGTNDGVEGGYKSKAGREMVINAGHGVQFLGRVVKSYRSREKV